MRILVLDDVSGVGAFVVNQVCGEVFTGGEGFGNVVLGMSVNLGVGLGLACCVNLDGVGTVLGVVLLEFNGACWFLNLPIRGLLHRLC